MRYLGLDLGTKTLGIAITDKTNTLSSPLKTLHFSSEDYESVINDIKEIISNYQISEIALGNPINMDGSRGFASKRSLSFKDLLNKEFPSINVTLIDERLTSVTAHNILSENGKKAINHKKSVDAIAATIILDTFLARKGNNNG